jgi:hypothetical protein
MESRINKTLSNYVRTFKNDLANVIKDMETNDKGIDVNELISYIYDYQKLVLNPTDFNKRKRLKNTIPVTNRCNACKANGEQCTRRRKEKSEFCGTHSKGVPHGMVKEETNTSIQGDTLQNLDIFGEDINGIIYYMDKYNNVYNMEDIMMKKINPGIVGSYELVNGVYKIHINS